VTTLVFRPASAAEAPAAAGRAFVLVDVGLPFDQRVRATVVVADDADTADVVRRLGDELLLLCDKWDRP